MTNQSGRHLGRWMLAIALLAPAHAWTATPAAEKTGDKKSTLEKSPTEKNDALLSTMQQELQRAQSSLGKLDPAPYYMSYSVYDQSGSVAMGTQGGLINFTQTRRRAADVTMRIGSPALDNSHEPSRSSAISSGTLVLDDDRDALAHELWRLTYEEYRKASKAYSNVKTGKQVHAEEEDTSPDFSEEKAPSHADYQEVPAPPDRTAMEKMAREYSAYFRKYPYIYSSAVVIIAQETRLRFASTEGRHVVTPGATIRMAIDATTLAPAAEPFDGPALLSGRASAVFFHEVLGHRLEGHRQRGEKEGQTFTKKVNQLVLPEFLSVVDDPTLRTLNGIDLGGYYEFDNEGMPAVRVEVIQDGVLKNFLMSRMPIRNFANSNGHGRSQPGLMPTGRQGNLIVSSTHTVKDSELRQKLIDEVKKQGNPTASISKTFKAASLSRSARRRRLSRFYP